jgi:hypothetical protein
MTVFSVSPELRKTFEKYNVPAESTVTHRDLIKFYNEHHPTKTLMELMRLCTIVPREHPVTTVPKSPEFIKSMEQLRLKQKEMEYQKLLNPSPSFSTLYDSNDTKMSIHQQTKEAKSHLTTIFNIIISVGSVVYAIWYWTETSWNLASSWRVLLCLFFGLLVLVAEVVVYMSYLNKIDSARSTESSKKEMKKIVKTIKL